MARAISASILNFGVLVFLATAVPGASGSVLLSNSTHDDWTVGGTVSVNCPFSDFTGFNLSTDIISSGTAPANLSGSFFINADLTGADLTSATLDGGALLIGATITGADLTSANLQIADLTNANLTNADLTNTDITNATFSNTNFTNATLTGADFTSVSITGIVLTDADLSGANLSGVDLSFTLIDGANLTGANLTGTDLGAADLSNANLSLADLTGADLGNADLTGANLHLADLTNAELDDAFLNNADLTDATLTGVDFSFANLTGADLTGVVITSPVTLTGATLTNAIVPGANLSSTSIDNATLNGANLSGANLDTADLSFSDLTGVNFSGADLSNATLSANDLSNADLTGADLTGIVIASPIFITGVNFMNAILPGIDLSFYALGGLNFSGANLTGADLHSSILDGANLSTSNLTNANLDSSILTNADLTNADLTGADLNAVTSGGILGIPSALPASWQLTQGYLIGPGANLSGADLSGADLSGADLTGANLTSATLTNVNLANADLTNATLTNANLNGVRSGGILGVPSALPAPWQLIMGFLIGPGADLAGADLTGFDLSNADLAGADFTGAILDGVNLSNADLSNADFTGANLSGATLTGANFSGADLTSADLTGVKSGGITGVPAALPAPWQLIQGFLAGPGADLAGAALSGADLAGADLTGADFTGADLSGADLTDANLTGADLTNADLTGADLTGTLFSGATLTGTILSGAFSVVDTIVDELDSPAGSDHSLREALRDVPAGITILFDAALSGQTITLLGGTQLTIAVDVTIDASALSDGITVSGDNASRVFEIAAGTTVSMMNLSITAGAATGANPADRGGGVFNNGGTVTLTNGTLFGNAANLGGALFNASSGDTTLVNITVSGNTTPSSGGAIANDSGVVTLRHVTLSGNTAGSFGGGIDNAGGAINIENSIVAGNSGPPPGSGADIANRAGGTIISFGANLIGDNDTVATEFPAGSLAGTSGSPLDPLLDLLGFYGGTSLTRPPVFGSPAIEGAVLLGGTPGTDQRGNPRPSPSGGPLPDLGAVEALPIEEALDAANLPWITGGNGIWYGQADVTHDGLDAARSGHVGDGQESFVDTTVTGAGTLSFWWKVSSEASADFLRFFLDGDQQPGAPQISGEVDWQQATVPIPAGVHTLRWTYSKDGMNSAGSDAGWLDEVVYSMNPPVITSSLTAGGIEDAAFNYQITATNAPTSFDATGLPAGLMVNTATGLISGTPTAIGSFDVELSATNSGGTGMATLALTIVIPPPAITSSLSAGGIEDAAFNYQITATNTPTSFDATGLPAGLMVNTSTGLISGMPTEIGSFDVELSATNSTGTGMATLALTIVIPPPVITSSLTAGGIEDAAFNYQITATNTPTSFNATGLPAGLMVNTSTGLISGAPTEIGSFDVELSATNATGTGMATLALTVVIPPPVITSALTAGGIEDAAFNYQITATNTPTSFNATGLPAGLMVNTSTGLISGAPTEIGSFDVELSATNATGTGMATLALTVVIPPPVITSSLTAGGIEDAAFNYQITATNTPTSFNATGLPAGLMVNTSTGLISGAPTEIGSFDVELSATNSTGTGMATLALTIVIPPPVITSALTAGGIQDEAFNYQITATNTPTSFNATGLPAGLMVNTSTGLISGMPTAIGSFDVELSATNSTGTGMATLALTIVIPPPVITSSLTAGGIEDAAFNYQITATNTPTSFNATGLPAGLMVNTSTGLISGAPTEIGSFDVELSATNATGTGMATLELTVVIPPPVITSALTAGGIEDAAFNYQITATNTPTSFNATGLPAGLMVNTSTGLISGAPTEIGSFDVELSATNATGTGMATLALTVVIPPPVITSALTEGGIEGETFNYQITATNAPTSFNATGLPAGLMVNTSTGVISGMPTAIGSFDVELSATNSTGTGMATLALTIVIPPPVITSSLTAGGVEGAAFNYQITATNAPTSFNATGLPAGLMVNTSTGVISGMATEVGSFDVELSATNSTGTGMATLALKVITTVVSTTGDSGPRSLRQVIADVADGTTITFAPALDGGTITLGGTQVLIDKSITIDASSLPSGVTVDANGAVTNHRVFEVAAGNTVAMNNLTITGGDAVVGGGIFNHGTLTLTDCSVVGNESSGDGGGIRNDATTGSLTFTNGLISDNSAGGSGGGVSTAGVVPGDVANGIELKNVTVTGNQATGAGGGLHVEFSHVSLVHSTVANNSAGDPLGGGGIFTSSGDFHIENSVVGGNVATASAQHDLAAAVTTRAGVNFIGDPTGATGLGTPGTDFLAGDPKLAALADYGGRTETRPPLPGSRVIEGAIVLAETPATDQRGASRPSGPLPDIGAVEAFSFSALPLIDTDNDGIDDRLELAYPQFTVGVDDSALDSDRDGSRDAEELANMTDPLNGADFFKILSITFGAGYDAQTNRVFDVTWKTFPGHSYTLECEEGIDFGNAGSDLLGPFTAPGFTHTESVLYTGPFSPTDFIRVRRN